MFARILSKLGLCCVVSVSAVEGVAAPFTAISRTSISASWPTSITLTGTASAGDKADFFPSCAGTEPKTQLTAGQNQATVFVVDAAATGLKLCHQAFGQSAVRVQEVDGISLDVVAATSPQSIKSINLSTAIASRQYEIALEGGKEGAKAIFIPQAAACKSSQEPSTILNSAGVGAFMISSPGDYKLCYRDHPGGSDSVEQVSSDLSYPIKLRVFDPSTSTTSKIISSISPQIVTVNVATMIHLQGTALADAGAWVHGSTCEGIDPRLDMSAGHRMFTFTTTGTYRLCYRVRGASDSVLQEDISLTVIPPGVIGGDMINRWQEKPGTVDCSSLNQIPQCGQALEATCSNSFMIDHGRGYLCYWVTSTWPPECQSNASTADGNLICKTNTCGGSTSKCWSTLQLED